MLHALDSSQKTVRVQVWRRLLDFLESRTGRSLWNAYTGDETWLYLDNHPISMWIGTNVPRPIRVRRTVTSEKRMFCIDFSMTRIRAASKAKS
jgi:hypothetical protein